MTDEELKAQEKAEALVRVYFHPTRPPLYHVVDRPSLETLRWWHRPENGAGTMSVEDLTKVYLAHARGDPHAAEMVLLFTHYLLAS